MTLISQPGSDYQAAHLTLDAGNARDIMLLLPGAHAVLDHLYPDSTQADITDPAEDYPRDPPAPTPSPPSSTPWTTSSSCSPAPSATPARQLALNTRQACTKTRRLGVDKHRSIDRRQHYTFRASRAQAAGAAARSPTVPAVRRLASLQAGGVPLGV